MNCTIPSIVNSTKLKNALCSSKLVITFVMVEITVMILDNINCANHGTIIKVILHCTMTRNSTLLNNTDMIDWNSNTFKVPE